MNGKEGITCRPGTTTVRSVSIVTTAGPLRRTASATNDWRDSTAFAAGDWANTGGRPAALKVVIRASGHTREGTSAMRPKQSDLDRKQISRSGQARGSG